MRLLKLGPFTTGDYYLIICQHAFRSLDGLKHLMGLGGNIGTAGCPV
jgi:hypothetical protein